MIVFRKYWKILVLWFVFPTGVQHLLMSAGSVSGLAIDTSRRTFELVNMDVPLGLRDFSGVCVWIFLIDCLL